VQTAVVQNLRLNQNAVFRGNCGAKPYQRYAEALHQNSVFRGNFGATWNSAPKFVDARNPGDFAPKAAS
jgi:hypothetical protein